MLKRLFKTRILHKKNSVAGLDIKFLFEHQNMKVKTSIIVTANAEPIWLLWDKIIVISNAVPRVNINSLKKNVIANAEPTSNGHTKLLLLQMQSQHQMVIQNYCHCKCRAREKKTRDPRIVQSFWKDLHSDTFGNKMFIMIWSNSFTFTRDVFIALFDR